MRMIHSIVIREKPPSKRPRKQSSIVVFEIKIVSLADEAWQSVLDCTDRFVAVFNLGGQSAS